MDIGLLVLRLVVGLLFIGHGTQKLFGWFGGHGLEGTSGFFEGGLGYPRGRLMAAAAGLGEAGGGLLLALGFLTPLGAAAIVGVMVNAIMSVHARNGMWNQEGGMEYPLVNIAAAVALAFTGAGAFSADAALGWNLSGRAYGFGAVALGVLTGLLVFSTRRPRMQEAAAEAPRPREERRAA